MFLCRTVFSTECIDKADSDTNKIGFDRYIEKRRRDVVFVVVEGKYDRSNGSDLSFCIRPQGRIQPNEDTPFDLEKFKEIYKKFFFRKEDIKGSCKAELYERRALWGGKQIPLDERYFCYRTTYIFPKKDFKEHSYFRNLFNRVKDVFVEEIYCKNIHMFNFYGNWILSEYEKNLALLTSNDLVNIRGNILKISELYRGFRELINKNDFVCAGHDVKLGGASPLRAELRRSVSLDKGVHREVESEGS